MRSFTEAVVQVLGQNGTMEIESLVQQALRLRPSRAFETKLIERVWREAADGRSGFRISSQPSYRLRARRGPPPTSRHVRCAVDALSKTDGAPLSLADLSEAYRARYGDAAICPDFWMYVTLETEGGRYVERVGDVKVAAIAQRNPTVSSEPASKRSATTEAEIRETMHEHNLESLVAENLEALERGLTLVGRQYSTPIGRIDLLCRDRKRNLVAVELKRFGANTGSIVDQVTRYMGWLREHVAKPNERVRGILVVGQLDEKLRYSVRAVEGLEVRCFDVTLRRPE